MNIGTYLDGLGQPTWLIGGKAVSLVPNGKGFNIYFQDRDAAHMLLALCRSLYTNGILGTLLYQ